ncbi:MAG TPA: glycoside hydrolase family 3 N-terminal domain-containing protein [Polyangia bacterium]|nr:glycoside hydrolase family 3 N-terminal domain-containing protein [Polyangia bacterium]
MTAAPRARRGIVLRGCGMLALWAACARPAPATVDSRSAARATDVLFQVIPGHPACVAPSTPSTAFSGRDDFPSPACRARAAQFQARMTLREKAAQMVQLGRDQVRPDEIAALSPGSILSGGGSGPPINDAAHWAAMVADYHAASRRSRLGIPILYGADAVHGHGNVRGAVIFPHPIGLGAAGDPDLVQRIARATAEEVAATGIDWTFAPLIAPARDARWGRTYESFGETPALAAEMGAAAIRGLQGPRLGQGPASILACAKHFLGDGATRLGVNAGDVDLDEAGMRALLLPAYVRAVDAHVGSVMASYSSVRGVRMHCNGRWLTDVLKRELGFNGFVVSDWEAVEEIAPGYDTGLALSINAGIDMVMHPKIAAGAIDAIARLVPERVSEARVDDAVRRILAIKCELGLLDGEPSSPAGESAAAASGAAVGSEAHRRLAREAVRRSLVVLKNRNATLPLRRDLRALVVVGRNASDLGNQCGGWTIDWQGASGPITVGTTIQEGIQRAVGARTRVAAALDGGGVPGAIIAVIGETPYAETAGDRKSLDLEPADVEVVRRAKASGAPVVVVVVTGRPLVLGPVADLADAIVVAWLPGSEGAGVADVLFGDAHPTGRLPHDWPRVSPRSTASIPVNAGEAAADPLFPLGFGLRY